jgi:hypothetical protein
MKFDRLKSINIEELCLPSNIQSEGGVEWIDIPIQEYAWVRHYTRPFHAGGSPGIPNGVCECLYFVCGRSNDGRYIYVSPERIIRDEHMIPSPPQNMLRIPLSHPYKVDHKAKARGVISQLGILMIDIIDYQPLTIDGQLGNSDQSYDDEPED